MQAQNPRTAWMPAAEELQHLLRARKGDRKAFLALLRHYHRAVFRLAFALTRDVRTAFEITHEAVLRAHEDARHVPEGQRFFPWLAQLVRGLVRVRRRSDPRSGVPAPASPGAPAMDLMRRTLEVLDSLDPDEQAALALAVAERLPYAQIETTLRIAPGTALGVIAGARSRFLDPAEGGEQAA